MLWPSLQLRHETLSIKAQDAYEARHEAVKAVADAAWHDWDIANGFIRPRKEDAKAAEIEPAKDDVD